MRKLLLGIATASLLPVTPAMPQQSNANHLNLSKATAYYYVPELPENMLGEWCTDKWQKVSEDTFRFSRKLPWGTCSIRLNSQPGGFEQTEEQNKTKISCVFNKIIFIKYTADAINFDIIEASCNIGKKHIAFFRGVSENLLGVIYLKEPDFAFPAEEKREPLLQHVQEQRGTEPEATS